MSSKQSSVSLYFNGSEEEASSRVDDAYISKYPQRSFSEATNLNLLDLTECVDGSERRVLVLYTGGTIGMVRNENNVLAPSPGIIENRVRSYPNMHDSEYAGKRFRCPQTSALVLPKTDGDERRVVYTVYEYLPLLDSSNMTMDDWIRIAKDIKQAYTWFDGFVILHGTDTMAYTASALSFMLENLGKSVVITGSQIPIFETRSDGRDNMIVALIMAGLHTVPEVTVYFNHALFRGNRTTKLSTASLGAFGSPNLRPLARVGIDIQVDAAAIHRPNSISQFGVHTTLCRHVGLLRLFPSITTETVRSFLQPPMMGVVLQSYGAGNVPSNRADLLSTLREAAERGVLIVNCSQCLEGTVKAAYETGTSLLNVGVLPGSDMTPEAALTKLAYVLSKDDWSIDTKRLMMQRSLRGEMACPGERLRQESTTDLVTCIADQLSLATEDERTRLRSSLYPSLLCSAAQRGSIQMAEQLLKNGADVNGCDYDRRTPLHVAAADGQLQMLVWLLRRGASVHVRDRHGHTPLQQAVHFERVACVRQLVACGAHITLAPTALGEQLCSAAWAGRVSTLECFYLANADLSQADGTGRTALHVAALSGNADVCRMLLTRGARRDVTDVLGMQPDQYASEAGSFSCQRLIQQYAQPECQLSDAGSQLSAFVSSKFDLQFVDMSPPDSSFTPHGSPAAYSSSTNCSC